MNAIRQKSIRGLWVESLGPRPALSAPDSVRALIAYAASHEISDIYLQVYREGRTWFSSVHAGQEYYQSARSPAFEPLREAVTLAHDAGIRLHAWLNVFNLGLNQSAPILRQLGTEALLADNRGVSLDRYTDSGAPPDSRAQYFMLDAVKLWLDPSMPEVKRYILSIVEDALSAAPEIDGIHLDFFRFPYLLPMQPSSRISCGYEFGYGNGTRNRFMEAHNQPNAFIRDQHGDLRLAGDEVSLQFDRWRREAVTAYLPAIRAQLAKPQVLSVACLAWADRAFFTSFQNWRSWLLDGLVDQVCLMAYTADDELFNHLIRQACAFQTEMGSVIAGLGAYLHKEHAQTKRQQHSAVRLGARGWLLFSYENIRRMETGVT